MASINFIHFTVLFLAFNLKFSMVENYVVITIKEETGNQNSFNGTCLTADCIKQAAHFLNNIDEKVNPCDDFYKYTCGNFMKKSYVPQGRRVVSRFTTVGDSLENDLIDEVQTEIQPDDLDAFKKMKIYYQNCLNESRIEEAGIEPYLEILKKSGGWPILVGNTWNEETYTWNDTLIKIQFLGLTTGFPFSLNTGPNEKNETNNIFYLFPGFTLIRNETELYSENNKTLNAYYDYILDIAVMLGANKTTVDQEVKDLIAFEIELSKIRTPFEEMKKNSSLKQQKTIQEFGEQFPSIEWLELFNSLLSLGNETANGSDEMKIYDVNYIDKLTTLLKETPKRTLANYQIWRVLGEIISFMPKKFVTRKRMYDNVILGINSVENREMECLGAVEEDLYIALNALYVRKYFDHDIKKKVTQMTDDIKNQFIENFKNGWQSHQNTTEEILKQLNSMKASIAYPDELLDDKKIDEYYTNLDVDPGLYISSTLNISLFEQRKEYESFRKPVEKNIWVQLAFVAFVNAFYSRRNIIGIPAGILHEPFIYARGPEYLNYGAIGSIIAHEITHGLYRSRQEKNENDTSSESNSIDKSTKHSDQCVIEKYNGYNISEGFAVNGSSTVNENIPDITGYKVAYQVYNEWTKRNKLIELNLPGLDYTPRQMFWISAASNFCSKTKSKKYLKSRLEWDSHSPAEARVNVAFSNIDEFANDFQCKEGSKMNPVKKCDLWKI